MFSSKRMFWALAVPAALICVALLVSGKQPVYAQVAGNQVPNLIGPWEVYMPTNCYFSNMVDPAVPPVPICGTPDDNSTSIEITHQSGRVFAGNHPGASDKLTGYLSADGTVSVHYFSPSAHEREHIFITATLRIERGTYVMRGYSHGFSELPMPPGNIPYMQTVELYAVKQ